jgi:hypothetical protein
MAMHRHRAYITTDLAVPGNCQWNALILSQWMENPIASANHSKRRLQPESETSNSQRKESIPNQPSRHKETASSI